MCKEEVNSAPSTNELILHGCFSVQFAVLLRDTAVLLSLRFSSPRSLELMCHGKLPKRCFGVVLNID